MVFPDGSAGEEPTCNAGDVGLIPRSGRLLEGGHDNSFQYSCWEDPTNGGAWWATTLRVAESQTQLKRLSTYNDAYRVIRKNP